MVETPVEAEQAFSFFGAGLAGCASFDDSEIAA